MSLRSSLLLFGAICLVQAHIKQHRAITKPFGTSSPDNCSASDDDDFPQDLFTQEQRQEGAIILHFIGGLYGFIIIAFVCNDYFLPSVDCICQDLNLSKDVAGATFMALATSAPELFVNIIGTFITKSDLGVGTVVGSNVFNTLGVAACGGLAARSVIKLEIWPLARDCGIFAGVVVVLTVILWDELVEWYEALILVLLYIVYCIVLFCQRKLHSAAKTVLKTTKSFSSNLSQVTLTSTASAKSMDWGTYRPFHHHGEVISYMDKRPSCIREGDVHAVANNHHRPSLRSNKLSNHINHSVSTIQLDSDPEKAQVTPVPEEDESETGSLWSPPKGIWSKLWWAVSWPVSFCLFLTIPDCRTWRKLYPLTFVMCTAWIGLASYVVSWMVTVIGQTFSISASVMGLTLVAMGGSMPEASTSIINARLGIGSMSISNALGGNTLDILLSLGLPWFIKTQLPEDMEGGPIKIESSGLVYNNLAQLACTVALFAAAAFNSYRMDWKLGSSCLVLYLLFIGLVVGMELSRSDHTC